MEPRRPRRGFESFPMKPNFKFFLVMALGLLSPAASIGAAADWPHIMGLNLDRKTEETISTAWPARGPKRVWEIPAEGGFGSFVTGDGKAYTVIASQSHETAIA